MWHKIKTKYEILLELWHKKPKLCQIFTTISLLGFSILGGDGFYDFRFRRYCLFTYCNTYGNFHMGIVNLVDTIYVMFLKLFFFQPIIPKTLYTMMNKLIVTTTL